MKCEMCKDWSEPCHDCETEENWRKIPGDIKSYLISYAAIILGEDVSKKENQMLVKSLLKKIGDFGVANIPAEILKDITT
jgi:hypothetical protein